jgi:hypothetical protein
MLFENESPSPAYRLDSKHARQPEGLPVLSIPPPQLRPQLALQALQRPGRAQYVRDSSLPSKP